MGQSRAWRDVAVFELEVEASPYLVEFGYGVIDLGSEKLFVAGHYQNRSCFFVLDAFVVFTTLSTLYGDND